MWEQARAAANLLLVVALSVSCLGCASTWRPVPNDRIETTLKETQPDVARVQAGGPVLRVRNPSIRADTLRGTVKIPGGKSQVSIPAAEIDSLWLPRKPVPPAVGVWSGVATMMVIVAFLWPRPNPPIH